MKSTGTSTNKVIIAMLIFSALMPELSKAQSVLTLPEAMQNAVQNYGTIKAKQNYAMASSTDVTEAKREYLPNLTIGAEQAYGTVNEEYGPMYALGGLGV